MNTKPKIVCSRCGSENTELRDSPSDGPLPIRLAERLLRQLRPVHGRLPVLRARVLHSGALGSGLIIKSCFLWANMQKNKI